MAPKLSRNAEFPAVLSGTVARALILLLLVFHPSLWIPDAIAQQPDNGDAAARPEPTPATEGKSLLSIRRPIWSETSSELIAAFLQNQPTATTTPQTSPQPPKTPAPPTAQKKSNKLMWILIGAAGGGAVAVFALKGKGESDSSTPQTPLTTVTAGPPTVGAPQ